MLKADHANGRTLVRHWQQSKGFDAVGTGAFASEET
jgi:methylmalonyl-CoA mutase cobalamin-binding subunit